MSERRLQGWVWGGERAAFPGEVVLRGEEIAAVERRPADAVPRDRLLLPGLVNAHVHLDLTFPREPGSVLARPFTDWLLSVRDLRQREGEDGLAAAARRGVRRALETGTTALVDYDARGASLAALGDSPIRRLVLREVITFEPLSGERRAELRSFLAGSAHPREVRGLAPHAPYTVHTVAFAELVRLCRELERPWSTHLAELRGEVELFTRGTGPLAGFLARFERTADDLAAPGVAPLRFLVREALLDRAALLVHGNHLTEEDIADLSATGASVVYCPRSHAWFGHPEHPLPHLIAAGVPLALGTDGAVSAGDLDLLGELRTARRAFPSIPSERLLALVTRDAHAVLGQRLGNGRLAPGQPADVAVFAFEAPVADDPLAALLAGDVAAGCVETVIAGELAWKDGAL